MRDVGSTLTLGTSLGGPHTSRDVIALLECIRGATGALPLALVLDNGPENKLKLKRWCRRHRVILLYNLPHTPQHNPCAEHGNGELKAWTGLGKGVFIGSLTLTLGVVLVALGHIDFYKSTDVRSTRCGKLYF